MMMYFFYTLNIHKKLHKNNTNNQKIMFVIYLEADVSGLNTFLGLNFQIVIQFMISFCKKHKTNLSLQLIQLTKFSKSHGTFIFFFFFKSNKNCLHSVVQAPNLISVNPTLHDEVTFSFPSFFITHYFYFKLKMQNLKFENQVLIFFFFKFTHKYLTAF